MNSVKNKNDSIQQIPVYRADLTGHYRTDVNLLFSRSLLWQAVFRGTHETIPPFRLRKNLQNLLVGGRPPNPPAGSLALPCERSTGGAAACPCGHCRTGDLTGWERCLSLKASDWTHSRPVRGDGKAAGGGAFLGLEFQYPISVLQECMYSRPACHDYFRRN